MISLSVSLFLSVTTYDATKNQFSPHVRFWSEYCYAELIFLGRSVSVHSKWEKTSSSQPLFHLYTLSLASKERDYNFFQTFEMKLPTLFSFLCYAYLKKRLSFFWIHPTILNLKSKPISASICSLYIIYSKVLRRNMFDFFIVSKIDFKTNM